MENNDDNDSKWDKSLIVAVLAIIVGAVVAITTPELRKLFCLEKPAPPVTEPQMEPTTETEFSNPQKYAISENKSQFIKDAETELSARFNEEYTIVTLTIAPDGKPSSNRAVLNGYTEEFTSSAGDFLVHILNVDWNSRTVTVQVSRKS
jgi:hypothetical protein